MGEGNEGADPGGGDQGDNPSQESRRALSTTIAGASSSSHMNVLASIGGIPSVPAFLRTSLVAIPSIPTRIPFTTAYNPASVSMEFVSAPSMAVPSLLPSAPTPSAVMSLSVSAPISKESLPMTSVLRPTNSFIPASAAPVLMSPMPFTPTSAPVMAIPTTLSSPCSVTSAKSKALTTSLEGTSSLPNAFPAPEFPPETESRSLSNKEDDICHTPRKRIFPLCGLTCTPEVEEHFIPAVGMEFADLDSAEKFYKDYAHEAGFSVRIGQNTMVNGEVIWKRFYCSREGFRGKGKKKVLAPSNSVGKKKRKYVRKQTRCGCEAMIAVKHTPENRFRVEIFQPTHVHILVSPRSRHLLRSNRQVSEKVKTALFDCHKASIGTSLAYRYLRVNAGGFPNVGCTKQDLQNYHGNLRNIIKTRDAQMFVDNLAKNNSINSGFYFDYVVDDDGKLVNVFWADTTCRKNYVHFGEMVSFDATYNTNEYNMKFTPFTGVNHHGSCVLLGAALISDERIESYIWLFNTFLKAMGGTAPKLIITDEDASMKAAIAKVFPTSMHRLCMWHILTKLPNKLGSPVKEDKDFYKRLNHCVYNSETSEEFELEWDKIIGYFELRGNEWLANRYNIRTSWVPVYFREIFLSGILRTTSRSESANSYFKCFIDFKQSLVEFWVRFDTAVEEQRELELTEDNASIHTDPVLMTGWPIEKYGSEVFTYKIFLEFQKEVLTARDSCIVDSMKQEGNFKVLCSIIDDSPKVREVSLDMSTMVGHCSCMLFQSYGIPCHHIIHVLRSKN